MALKHALLLSLIAAAVAAFGALVYFYPPAFLVNRAEAAPVTPVPTKVAVSGYAGAVPGETGTPAPDRSPAAPVPTEDLVSAAAETAVPPTGQPTRRATARPASPAPAATTVPTAAETAPVPSPAPSPTSDAEWLRQDNARRIRTLSAQTQAELDEYNRIEQEYENDLLGHGGGENSWIYYQYDMDAVYAAQAALTARIGRLNELAARNQAAGDPDELAAIGEEITGMEQEWA